MFLLVYFFYQVAQTKYGPYLVFNLIAPFIGIQHFSGWWLLAQ